MRISNHIVLDYLAGNTITAYQEEWFFHQPNKDGIAALKECFDKGYHGFAAKCAACQ